MHLQTGTCNFTIMEPSGQAHIRSLIAQGEHQELDFKFEISDARKIARTLSAFSNTDGGRLLIGVKDNGRISGIRSDEEFYMVGSAASLYCKPEVRFESRSHTIEGKSVLEIYIPPVKKNLSMPGMKRITGWPISVWGIRMPWQVSSSCRSGKRRGKHAESSLNSPEGKNSCWDTWENNPGPLSPESSVIPVFEEKS